ncbi:MAG: YihY/virulence factor BrkB family protein [Solirubrobacteraceae bacterium]
MPGAEERPKASSTPGKRAAKVKRVAPITKGALVAFWRDQGTHHAGALTYYALMSLFPLLLLAVSLLGLIGQYPSTYNAIIHHLRSVVPTNALSTVNAGLKAALRDRGTALVALLLGVFSAFYGATGYLEAARRAFNVVFAVGKGRSFMRRKLTDIASTIVLLVLVISAVLLMFGTGHVVRGLVGSDAASVWRIGRWPLAVLIALVVFSFLYVVTPDTPRSGLRSIIPGAGVGVAIWLLASVAFSEFLARISSLDATYGSFAAVVVLLVWLWLTNVALFLGAEVNAEIARRRVASETSFDANGAARIV